MRKCEECGALNSLGYDVCASGYICQKCGTVFGEESVELGDFDVYKYHIVRDSDGRPIYMDMFDPTHY